MKFIYELLKIPYYLIKICDREQVVKTLVVRKEGQNLVYWKDSAFVLPSPVKTRAVDDYITENEREKRQDDTEDEFFLRDGIATCLFYDMNNAYPRQNLYGKAELATKEVRAKKQSELKERRISPELLQKLVEEKTVQDILAVEKSPLQEIQGTLIIIAIIAFLGLIFMMMTGTI